MPESEYEKRPKRPDHNNVEPHRPPPPKPKLVGEAYDWWLGSAPRDGAQNQVKTGPLGDVPVVADSHVGPMPPDAVRESDYDRMVRIYERIRSKQKDGDEPSRRNRSR